MPFKRILCAVDFSPDSVEAFRIAVELTRLYSASLHVLHVLEAQPATPTDSVTLAVAETDPSAAPIQFLQVPKTVFLQKDGQAVVKSTMGEQLTLKVVRPNYVNTAVAVTDAKGREFAPLLVRYPVEKNGGVSEVVGGTGSRQGPNDPDPT